LPKAVEVELRDPETRKAFREHARQQVALHGWEWLEDLVQRAQERGDDRLLRDVRAMMLGFGHGTPAQEQPPEKFDMSAMIARVHEGIQADKAARPQLPAAPLRVPQDSQPLPVEFRTSEGCASPLTEGDRVSAVKSEASRCDDAVWIRPENRITVPAEKPASAAVPSDSTGLDAEPSLDGLDQFFGARAADSAKHAGKPAKLSRWPGRPSDDDW